MTPCVWSHRTPSQRYPQINVGGKVLHEHRFVWEEAYGPIPDGLFVCHQCDNKRCIRLDHLFLGTNGDNQRDASLKGLHGQSSKTHCPRGHAYSDHGYVRPSRNGWTERHCLECGRIRRRSAV